MSAATRSSDDRRYRLATNDNEIVVEEEEDVEGHRLATNDNETTVPNLRRVDPSDEDEGPTALGARRLARR